MTSDKITKCFLTFDVEGSPGHEDFMDSRSLHGLLVTLKLLERFDLKGLFFITGTVAEKVCNDSAVFNLLSKHEIGFHSSTHSVKPRIFEYTDVSDYNEVMEAAIQRETSDIDPLTGKVIGRGGISRLREFFPDKKIESFRAPFNYFSPPHIEALKSLGFKHIFSGDFSDKAFMHKGLMFHPSATFIDDPLTKIVQIDYGKKTLTSPFLNALINPFIIFGMHPSSLMYKEGSPAALKSRYINPMRPLRIDWRAGLLAAFNSNALRSFFFYLSKLQKRMNTNRDLPVGSATFQPDFVEFNTERTIKYCLYIAKTLFNYTPKFLRRQYGIFFEMPYHPIKKHFG